MPIRFQLRDDSGTTLEIGPRAGEFTFISVLRDGDDEDEDRVFSLTRADAACVVGELVAWLAASPKEGGE